MATGVWVAVADRWSTISTVVVGEDGTALLVDPALTTAEVAGLADAVAARGWRVAAGFATHPHVDHLLWPAGLGEVPRYATTACLRAARRDRDTLVAEAAV
ncbi:MBL fold metallo-hydrolase, partial [Georgenia sp. 10Sc9-8]|nr:MBL fold metallo-hydrolase [Georgenia halotolerans]